MIDFGKFKKSLALLESQFSHWQTIDTEPIFRIANENRLLASEIAQWLVYADTRISTSHDYDGEKAKAALALMGDFIKDATDLYQKMSGENGS